jgi:hypothetical protein
MSSHVRSIICILSTTVVCFFILSAGLSEAIQPSDEGTLKLCPSGVGNESLLLLHSSSINSVESEAALSVWDKLKKSLAQHIKISAINCDDFSEYCRHLDTAHVPQVLLLSGADTIKYDGPITETALHTFVLHTLPSSLSDLDASTLDWWLETQVADKRAVLVLHDVESRLPHLANPEFRAVARKLRHTHRLAEIRGVTDSMIERFSAVKLPALVVSHIGGKRPFSPVYTGEMTASAILNFVGRESKEQKDTHSSDGHSSVDFAPEVTHGIPHLSKEAAAGLCREMCTIVFVPEKPSSSAQQRIRAMNFAQEVFEKLKRSTNGLQRASSIPALVWVSAAQRGLYSCVGLRFCMMISYYSCVHAYMLM